VIGGFFYMNPYSMPDLNYWKSLWLKQEQGVYMGIAGLVFTLLIFKRTFRLVIPKNVQLIFSTFGLYFAGSAALMVIRTYVGREFRSVRDIASMILYVGCLAIGGILFSRGGESESASPATDASARPEMAARAAQQLQSFNDRLVRVLNA
jgi:hypothetical protein